MAKKRKSSPPPRPEPPRLYEATLASGASGAVLKGKEIDLPTAVARRQAGLDIVVCGSDVGANRALARQVEAAVGTPTRPQRPHEEAGPCALPHFHQESRSPEGHSFYETGNRQRKARKRP